VIRAIFGDALLNPVTGEVTREAVVVIEDGRVTRAGRRDGVERVYPKMVFSPPWTPEMMSEDAKMELGFF